MADKKNLLTQIKIRRGTSQEFLTPKAIILAEGEPAYITDWNLFVVGNGNDNINDLIVGVRWAQYTDNADKLDNHDSTYFASTAELKKYLPLTGGTVTGETKIHSVGITNSNQSTVTEGAFLQYDNVHKCLKFVFKE